MEKSKKILHNLQKFTHRNIQDKKRNLFVNKFFRKMFNCATKLRKNFQKKILFLIIKIKI